MVQSEQLLAMGAIVTTIMLYILTADVWEILTNDSPSVYAVGL